MKRGVLSDPFQCKPAMGNLLSDFLISNDVLGGTLYVRLNMKISKLAVLLANEHRSDQKKCYKIFSYEFSPCIRSRKNDSVNGMPKKCSIKEDFNQYDSLIISQNIKQYQNFLQV